MPRTGITKQPNGKFRAFIDCGYDYDGKRIRKAGYSQKKEMHSPGNHKCVAK